MNEGRLASTEPVFEKERRFETKKHAALYAKGRPNYSTEIKESILQFLSEKCAYVDGGMFGQMVDVGCGSGQAVDLLADRFRNVIGIDSSKEQVAEALRNNTHQNTSYIVGDSEALAVMNDSTDLVTAAAALHWFDIEEFYAQVRRVLKPGGCLALWSYRFPSVEFRQNPDFSRKVTEFVSKIYDKDLVKGGWKSRRTAEFNDSMYKNVQPCFDNEKRSFIPVKVESDVQGLLSLFESYSSYQKLLQAEPDNTFLQDLGNKILEISGNPETSLKTPIQMCFTVFLLMSRKA